LTGKHPIRPTSPRFRRSRQPEPGRRSTYPPENLFRQAESALHTRFPAWIISSVHQEIGAENGNRDCFKLA
jgi:hypothetical protein